VGRSRPFNDRRGLGDEWGMSDYPSLGERTEDLESGEGEMVFPAVALPRLAKADHPALAGLRGLEHIRRRIALQVAIALTPVDLAPPGTVRRGLGDPQLGADAGVGAGAGVSVFDSVCSRHPEDAAELAIRQLSKAAESPVFPWGRGGHVARVPCWPGLGAGSLLRSFTEAGREAIWFRDQMAITAMNLVLRFAVEGKPSQRLAMQYLKRSLRVDTYLISFRKPISRKQIKIGDFLKGFIFQFPDSLKACSEGDQRRLVAVLMSQVNTTAVLFLTSVCESASVLPSTFCRDFLAKPGADSSLMQVISECEFAERDAIGFRRPSRERRRGRRRLVVLRVRAQEGETAPGDEEDEETGQPPAEGKEEGSEPEESMTTTLAKRALRLRPQAPAPVAHSLSVR